MSQRHREQRVDLRCWVAAAALAGGCASSFEMVDFKYTSDEHIPPSERFTTVDAPLDEVTDRAKAFFAEHDARNLQQLEGSTVRAELRPDSQEAWSAKRNVVEQEWQTFRDDDIRSYRRIDRSDPILQRDDVDLRPGNAPEGQEMRANLSPRTGQWEREAAFGVIQWSSTHDATIASTIYLWLWPDGSGRTRVYARGAPRLLNEQLEAAPGNSIRHELWEAADGRVEARLVRELLSYLRAAPVSGARADLPTR